MKAARLIRQVRGRAGITQRELARRLGTKQPVIARWESGSRQPDYQTVQRVVRACGFDLVLSFEKADPQEEALLNRWLQMTPMQRLEANQNMLDTERWARRAKVIGSVRTP